MSRHSHLNGYEFLQVHKPHIWNEISECLELIDPESHRTKVSKEARKLGKGPLYAPKQMNLTFQNLLRARGWAEHRVNNFVCSDSRVTRKLIPLEPERQREVLAAEGLVPISTYNQTDFLKDRVAVEFQFGKYSFVAHDIFVKHMAFFASDDIDVGIEIVPMKSLEEHMSSGVPYYERDLFNLIRQGRSTPAVPLVLVGVAP